MGGLACVLSLANANIEFNRHFFDMYCYDVFRFAGDLFLFLLLLLLFSYRMNGIILHWVSFGDFSVLWSLDLASINHNVLYNKFRVFQPGCCWDVNFLFMNQEDSLCLSVALLNFSPVFMFKPSLIWVLVFSRDII